MTIDDAWEILFDKYNIPEVVSKNGIFYISSREINELKEARLMAKFDQSAQLPEIFRINNLSILPVKRGQYAIGNFATHEEVIYSHTQIKKVDIPDLETIDPSNLYSESSALLFAYNSGIIQDILGSSKVNFTVNGRMASGEFDFEINDTLNASTHNISVKNAQVEIDAGYESPNEFCICEAKSMATNELLIRQLYYPYRLWKEKILKPVLPVFFVFSNDIFHIFIYKFDDDKYYNSIKLCSHSAYTFADEKISSNEISELLNGLENLLEPRVTFPQADSFERIIDLLSLLYNRQLSPDDVTLKYEFDPRQTSYYISACEYLGLLERSRGKKANAQYSLSNEGQRIMGLKYKDKYLSLIKKILEKPVFNTAFKETLKNGIIPNKKAVINIMNNSHLPINSTTIERRASTVRGWTDWILRQIE